MKILFALNAGEGGATMSACELIEGLGKRGHDCFAVHPPDASAEGVSRIASVTREQRKIYLPWWNRNYRAKLWKRPLLAARDFAKSRGHAGTIYELASLIRRWKIDIVHTNTAVTLEPALAARMMGVKHVWHIRERLGSRDLYRFWMPDNLLVRTFTALSDALIVNSHSTGALFEREGGSVTVVYNGVEVSRFFDAVARGALLRKSWGIGDDVVLVGMAASLASRQKRHELFVRAAAQIAKEEPNTRFVVAGHDPSAAGGWSSEIEYAANLKVEARELGLDGRLTFTGHIGDAPAIMSALDILIHPSDTEAFGRIGVEGMAAGKPVIGVRNTGLAEIIDDGVTGIVVAPNDASAFAAAALPLIRDRARRMEMGRAGRARAESYFAMDKTVDAVESIYSRISRSNAS